MWREIWRRVCEREMVQNASLEKQVIIDLTPRNTTKIVQLLLQSITTTPTHTLTHSHAHTLTLTHPFFIKTLMTVERVAAVTSMPERRWRS